MKPMECYAKRNVFLVGDAVCALFYVHDSVSRTDILKKAHPVTPHQGAGAGLAVEVGGG